MKLSFVCTMKLSSRLSPMLFVAFIFFTLSAITVLGSTIQGMVHTTHHGVTAMNRKLKEESKFDEPKAVKRQYLGTVNVEDYNPIDPVPSSKASVKPGPIEHGAPLIPYIPKPAPPDPPGRGGSG